MTNHQAIRVVDSWNLTRGIIAELEHELSGLVSDLLVKSTLTGKEWRVKSRILFHHTFTKQKKFENETITFVHSSFGNVENMVASEKIILEREKQNIFQYLLQPLGHDAEPVAGDILLPFYYR